MAKKQAVTAADLLAKINAKYGAGTITSASTAKGLNITRLPFDIFAVDSITGGGLPRGRITGFNGMKSSAKTYMAIKAVVAGQKYCRIHDVRMMKTDKKLYKCFSCGYLGEVEGDLCPECIQRFTKAELKVRDNNDIRLYDDGDYERVCPKCREYMPYRTLWIDSEGAWENAWAVRNGVNCSLVTLCRTEYAEQAIDIIDNLLRTREFDLCVIDSLAHLVPQTETTDSAEKWQQGLQARLLNKLMRKLAAVCNSPGLNVSDRPTVIMINQVRLKIGVMFGDPSVKPGGLGQEFVTSMDLKFWASKYEKSGEKEDDAGAVQSVLVNAKCEKNKTAPPQQQGNFRLWLMDTPEHRVGDNEEFNVVCGIAKEQGYFGNAKEGWSLYGNSYKTLKEITDKLWLDEELFITLRDDLLRLRLGTVASDTKALSVKPPELGELDLTEAEPDATDNEQEDNG